ncbi:MAG: MFS transporter [Phycisphaerales bacterium]|nr:MFS transporter [Phycisphaerales bacterium]
MTVSSDAVSTAPSALDLRARMTLRMECLRALGQGALETASTTFIMLIAVWHFHASDTMKALASINDKLGLLLSPLIVTIVMVRQFKAARAAAALMFIGGLGFTLSAIIPTLGVFVWGSLLGLTCAAAAIPLITQIYQDNYPASLRGKLFSQQLFIRIGVACAFGWLVSYFLGHRLTDIRPHYFQCFQFLMAAFAVALFLSAYALMRIPSTPLADPGRAARNPFYALQFVRDDKTFRNTLISWMIIGLANLMMVSLRVEYLANTNRFHVTLRGQALSAVFITLLTDIIPNAARFLITPVWGKIFDRFNFFLFRIAVNLGFGIAIVTFYTGDSYLGHMIGAAIWGISLAGGDLCWTLWVTKLAPPHRVAHYMSVHTFLTGVRGIASPFLAFYLVSPLGLNRMAVITSVMVVLSCLVLLPEIFNKDKKAPSRETEEQTAD